MMENGAFKVKINAVSCGQFGIYSVSNNLAKTLSGFIQIDDGLYINIDEIKRTAAAVCTGESGRGAAGDLRMVKLSEIINFIDENICDSSLSLKTIAARFNCSVSYISRIFYECYNMYYSTYVNTKRVKLALQYLEEGESVGNVSRRCGFCSLSAFRRIFYKIMNISPLKYKQTKNS